MFQGYLFSGGGTDAVNITVVTERGERIFAYCGKACGAAMFGAPDEYEVVKLDQRWIGRRVEVEVQIGRNAGRIAGPGDDERIPVLVRLKELKAN